MIDAVDQAVMTTLQADATLATLATGGVHREYKPESQPSGPFVIVELVDELPTYKHGGIAYQQTSYEIEVVDQSTMKTDAIAVLDRVDALLMGPLSIAGHTFMTTDRTSRMDDPERVGSDLWQHVGCVYTIWSCPS